jgi:hypothetical protein
MTAAPADLQEDSVMIGYPMLQDKIIEKLRMMAIRLDSATRKFLRVPQGNVGLSVPSGGQAGISCRERKMEVKVIGTQVLHYQILEKLGEGGMSQNFPRGERVVEVLRIPTSSVGSWKRRAR